jgi:phasin family protein
MATDKSTKPVDPFAELTRMFESFMPPGLPDVGTMLEKLRVPGIDISALATANRKDLEALVEANKIAYEGMQALARKQGEVLSQAMQSIQSVATGAAGSLQAADGAKLAEMARNTYQKALADMTELAQIAAKAQADAVASLTQRASEHVQELQQMMQPKK